MYTRKISLACALIGGVLFTTVCGAGFFRNQRLRGRRADEIKTRQAIQKIYNSPLYALGSKNRRWQALYLDGHAPNFLLDKKSDVESRIIQKLALQGDTANVVIKYHESIFVTDSNTKKRHRLESVDIRQDKWRWVEDKWGAIDSMPLSLNELWDGKNINK
ncbi:MAG: hypothetical protein EOO38_03530 [Cytophagaceae bacterium]|nr:MAG: hypothetical protein EOO38_03530 [Cytophagaceae bacterium]